MANPNGMTWQQALGMSVPEEEYVAPTPAPWESRQNPETEQGWKEALGMSVPAEQAYVPSEQEVLANIMGQSVARTEQPWDALPDAPPPPQVSTMPPEVSRPDPDAPDIFDEVPKEQSTPIGRDLQLLKDSAEKYGIPEELAKGVISAESSWIWDNVSRAGARGYSQLMPKTAEWLAKKMGREDYTPDMIDDPEFNIPAGMMYLGMLHKKYKNWDKALAAYNMGPGKLDEKIAAGEPISQKYVDMVKARLGRGPSSKFRTEAKERGLTAKKFSIGDLSKDTSPLAAAFLPVAGIGDDAGQRMLDVEQSTGRPPPQSLVDKYFLQMEKGRKQLEDARLSWGKDNLDPMLAKDMEMVKDIADTKKDTSKWWNDQGNAKKAGWIIATAIGGFMEGFTGGKIQNSALKMIDRLVAQDLAAQQSNLENKKAGLAAHRGLYAQLQNKYKDKKKAELMYMDSMYRLMEYKLREKAQDSKDSLSIINSNRMERALRLQHLEALQRIHATKFNQDLQARALSLKERVMASKMPKAGEGEKLPGHVEKMVSGAAGAIAAIDTAIAATERWGYSLWKRHIPGTAANRVKSAYLVPLIAALRSAGGESGIMDKGDFERWKNAIDNNMFTEKETLLRLRSLRKSALTKTRKEIAIMKSKYKLGDNLNQQIDSWDKPFVTKEDFVD